MRKKERQASNISKSIALWRMLRHMYLFERLQKTHAVAILGGGAVGGLFVGFAVAGYDVPTWLTILGICVGAVTGAVFAFSLVPRNSSHR